MAVIVAIVGGSIATGHGRELVFWYLAPTGLLLAGPYTGLVLSEHRNAGREIGIVDSSGTVVTNRFFQWLFLNGNYHLAHHVLPTTSWWELPALDARIEQWRADTGQRLPDRIRHAGSSGFTAVSGASSRANAPL